jgi:hypothetical protein
MNTLQLLRVYIRRVCPRPVQISTCAAKIPAACNIWRNGHKSDSLSSHKCVKHLPSHKCAKHLSSYHAVRTRSALSNTIVDPTNLPYFSPWRRRYSTTRSKISICCNCQIIYGIRPWALTVMVLSLCVWSSCVLRL